MVTVGSFSENIMMFKRPLALALCMVLTASAALFAEDWNNWRGPAQNGTSTEKNLPVKFSKTEGVKWTAELAGRSAATPIVVGDSIFLADYDTKSHELIALALNRADGKQLWRHVIAKCPPLDDRATPASSSPVSDGNRVIFFYANGDMAAYSLKGEKLWNRNIQTDYGQFAFLWTFSSSPLLHDNMLYLPVLQRDTPVNGRGKGDNIPSFILAIDPATGKTIWQHMRPAKAKIESLEAFSTIIPVTHAGRSEIIVVGGDDITGHDPKTGKELWRWGTWDPRRITHWRLVPSAVTGDGVVLAAAPKGEPIYAVKLGGNGKLSDDALAWVSSDRKVSSDVCTPAFHNGSFYILNGDRRSISRVEAKTGKVQAQKDLPGRSVFNASPTIADGKVYMISHHGKVVVASADDLSILNEAEFGEENADLIRSSIAVSGGMVFIRTQKHLYAIGK